MLMIDLLRLPGVEDARERLLNDGAYLPGGNPECLAVRVNSLYVDELIEAVAEAVERETARAAMEHLRAAAEPPRDPEKLSSATGPTAETGVAGTAGADPPRGGVDDPAGGAYASAPLRTGPVTCKGGHNPPPTAPRPAGGPGATKPPKKRCGCCERGGDYNGYGSGGPPAFVCPKGCACHD